MDYVKLGASGLHVSPLCIGSMMFGDRTDTADSTRIIETAHAAGINFIDTADVYSKGGSERIVGAAIKPHRREWILATKCGNPITARPHSGGSSRRWVGLACDDSLARLGTDYIDVWYQHRLDREVPIEETVGAMAEQVRAGKVRYLGLSEVGVATLRRAHAVHPISVLQSEYSLWERNIEGDVLATCRELGIGVVPYSPLGRGFLTGTVGNMAALEEADYRRKDPRWNEENLAHNQRIVDTLAAIATRHAATPAQVLAHPEVRSFFQSLVDTLWHQGTGSANRVARALLLEEPPQLDRGEVTDKGSINQRAVLQHRADLVERLYADAPDAQVILPRR